jgi:hypothetical protein
MMGQRIALGTGAVNRQTVFHWHAPTVLQGVRRFDRELGEHFAQQARRPEASRKAAISQIREIIGRLPACRKWRTLKPESRGPCCQIAERLSRQSARRRRR